MHDTAMELMIRFARPALVAIALQSVASAADFGLAVDPPALHDARAAGAFVAPIRPPAPPETKVMEGPIVRMIEVQYLGPATCAQEEIIASMGTTVGGHYSEQVVERDIPAIYKTGRIRNFRIFGEPLADGVKIIVVVQCKPRITEIQIRGAPVEIESALRNNIGARTGDLLDGCVLASDRQRIIDYYAQPGRGPVEVDYSEDINDSLGAAKVIFSIHDAPKERTEPRPASGKTIKESQLDFLTPVLCGELSEKSERTLRRRIAALESATMVLPENEAGWLQLGAAYVQLGTGYARVEKGPQAVDALRKAVRILREDAAAWQDLAACLFKQRSMGEALSASEHAMKIDPGSFDGWLIRGGVLTRARRFPEAKAAFEKAKALEPNSRIRSGFVAFLHLAEGRLDNFHTVTELAKIDPDDNLRWSAQSVALQTVQGYPRSLGELWERPQTGPEDPSFRVEMLARLLEDRFWGEAGDEARKFVDRDPSDKHAWSVLGWIDMKRERWKESVEELSKAHFLGFEPPDSDLALSRDLIELGKLEDAKRILTGFTTTTPKNADALSLFGVICRKEKRRAESEAYSKQALEMAPEHTIALMNLASNCIEMKQLPQAIAYALRVRNDDIEKWHAWALTATAQEQLGNTGAAAEAFKNVTELEPDRMIGWEGLARMSQGYDEACHAARKAFELDHESAAAQVLLGVTQARFGKNAEAMGSLMPSLVTSPVTDVALKALHEVLNPLKRTEAAEILERVTAERPEWMLGWRLLGENYLALQRFHEAVGALKKAGDPDDAPSGSRRTGVLADVVQAAAKNGDIESAKEACNELEKLDAPLARSMRDRYLPQATTSPQCAER